MNKEKIINILFIIVIPLLVSTLFFFLSFNSVKNLSYTTDEKSHLVRGVMLLRTGDYRLNQHHPILFNVLHSIPVAFDTDFKTVDLDDELWVEAKKDEIGMELVWINGGIEKYSTEFLVNARAAAGIVSAILLFIVYQLIRKFFGNITALITTVLFAFSPTLIAHSSLVTTDSAAVFTIFISSLALYHDLRKTKSNAKHFPYLFLVTAFIAVISKYTALLLLPFWIAAYVLVRYIGYKQKIRTVVLHTVITIFGILFLITAVYGFKFSTIYDVEYNNPDKIAATLDHLSTIDQNAPIPAYSFLEYVYREIKFPFPDFIKGFYDNVVKHNFHGHKTYLLGQPNNGGNPLYFPVAFISKETIPFIALSIFSTGYLLILFIKNRRKVLLEKPELTPLYITPLVLGILSISSSINIGVRHLMPLYPFIALGVSYTLYSLVRNYRKQTKRIVMTFCLLIIAHLLLTFAHFPTYISYFNQIVGAEKFNYLYLQDSNFDWEQELYIAENENRNLENTSMIVYPKEMLSGNIERFTADQKCIRYRFFRNEIEPIRELGNNYYIFDIPVDRSICDF